MGAHGDGMEKVGVLETCAGVHFGEFAEGVGIAGDGGGQHGHAESGGLWRRDTVFVGNEFEGGDATARLERAANFFEQADASVCIEMEQEVVNRIMVGSGKIDFEGAAGKHVLGS